MVREGYITMEKIHEIVEEAKAKMQKQLEGFQESMHRIRSGRATSSLVEDIQVEVYGQVMPINQLATISIPEARQILIDVWDKQKVQDIEKAIQKSGRNLNPQNDGGLIRVTLPELSEENRRELVKLTAQKLESYKITARNIRREANDSIKNLKGEGVSEDQIFEHQDKVQKFLDDQIDQFNQIFKTKEKEIMTI